MNVCMYALAHKRLLEPAAALSLCYTLSLSLLAQWYRVLFGGIWLPIVVWGVTYIFDCMNICTFVYVKEILLISVSSWERKRERERWTAPIVDRQLFWFFNLTTTAGNRQRTHLQMYTLYISNSDIQMYTRIYRRVYKISSSLLSPIAFCLSIFAYSMSMGNVLKFISKMYKA